MNRLHIHISVDDLEKGKLFYTALFNAEPTVVKDDYAKWMVEDPRVNLAISTRQAGEVGVNHLGVQAETAEELAALDHRLNEARVATFGEPEATCCYAESDKHWTMDPNGLIWEIFHSHGASTVYGTDHGTEQIDQLRTATLGAEKPVKAEPETSAKCCG